MYKCSDILAAQDLHQVAWGIHIEYDNVQAILLAECEGCHIHYLQISCINLVERYLVELCSCRVLLRVCGVDSINTGALEESVGLNLDAAQSRSRVGREVWVRCSTTNNYDISLAKVFESLILRVLLADRLHTD